MTRTRADASRAVVRLSTLLAVLLAAGLALAGTGSDMSVTSVDPEVLKGAPTASEMVAAQTDLHEWLMAQLPSGVTGRPIVVSLTRAEKRELADMQEAGGNDPADIGRHLTLGPTIRFYQLSP